MSLYRSSSESTFIKYLNQNTLHESVNALQPWSTSLLLITIHIHIAIQQYIASCAQYTNTHICCNVTALGDVHHALASLLIHLELVKQYILQMNDPQTRH